MTEPFSIEKKPDSTDLKELTEAKIQNVQEMSEEKEKHGDGAKEVAVKVTEPTGIEKKPDSTDVEEQPEAIINVEDKETTMMSMSIEKKAEVLCEEVPQVENTKGPGEVHAMIVKKKADDHEAVYCVLSRKKLSHQKFLS